MANHKCNWQEYMDALYGPIKLHPIQSRLILLPTFDKLRYSLQLGLTRKLYGCADQTRFQHSVGAGFAGLRHAEELELEEEDARYLIAEMTSHDFKHAPFGHALEDEILRHHPDLDHDTIGQIILTGQYHPLIPRDDELKNALEDMDIDPKVIAGLMKGKAPKGKTFLGQLCKGQTDIDQIDYLARDAITTSPSGKTVDMERLAQTATIINNRLMYVESAIPTIWALFTARKNMSEGVYKHKHAQNWEALLGRAVRLALGKDVLRVYEFNDGSLIEHLAKNPSSARLTASIRGENEYVDVLELRQHPRTETEKNNLYALRNALDDNFDFRDIETELRERTGLKEDELIVSYHDRKLDSARPLKTRNPVMIVPSKSSPASAARSLENYGFPKELTGRQYHTFLVASIYTRKEHADKVKYHTRKLMKELREKYL